MLGAASLVGLLLVGPHCEGRFSFGKCHCQPHRLGWTNLLTTLDSGTIYHLFFNLKPFTSVELVLSVEGVAE